MSIPRAARSFLSLGHMAPDEINSLLLSSTKLKTIFKRKEQFTPLTGYSMGMLFSKRSTRTRVSSEVGMSYLGGKAIFLGSEDIQLGANENIRDTATVLGRFHDIILARVYKHSEVESLVKYSGVPIINGLSDLHHPLQALADFMTLRECFGSELKGLKVAWVGDGNNILHSMMEVAPKMGVDLRIATPANHRPDSLILEDCITAAKKYGGNVLVTTDPVEAVKGTNVIVTDTWISMGFEKEKQHRLKSFAGYQVNEQLGKHAAKDWRLLHCLPRKQEEVTDEIFYSEKALVWDEAENRLYTVMSVILDLLGKKV